MEITVPDGSCRMNNITSLSRKICIYKSPALFVKCQRHWIVMDVSQQYNMMGSQLTCRHHICIYKHKVYTHTLLYQLFPYRHPGYCFRRIYYQNLISSDGNTEIC